MKFMRNFGFATYDKVDYVGTNGKMNEMSAAMGLTSFESLDDFIAANRRNHDLYRRELSTIPGLSLFSFNPAEKNNHQYIVLEIDSSKTGLTRDELVKLLWAENCLARRYFWPGCHNMEPYKSLFPHARLLLPNTELVADRVMLLPSGSTITEKEIAAVCSILRTAISYGSELRRYFTEKKEI